MASIKVRPAKSSDIPAIFHVRTSVVVNHMTEADLETIGITRQSVEQMLEAGEAGAWCVDCEGDVVGFSLAFHKVRELSALFVLPDYEQRGFGSALLDAAVRWLEEYNREPIRLSIGREVGLILDTDLKMKLWRATYTWNTIPDTVTQVLRSDA